MRANLVDCLVRMPLYQDAVSYRGREVPFYKRAQITCRTWLWRLRVRAGSVSTIWIS